MYINKVVCVGLAGLLSFTAVYAGEEDFMREAFSDKFLIGTALNVKQIRSRNRNLQNLIGRQFSAVVAENCMKGEVVQPKEGVFNFKDGDLLCELAERNAQDRLRPQFRKMTRVPCSS